MKFRWRQRRKEKALHFELLNKKPPPFSVYAIHYDLLLKEGMAVKNFNIDFLLKKNHYFNQTPIVTHDEYHNRIITFSPRAYKIIFQKTKGLILDNKRILRVITDWKDALKHKMKQDLEEAGCPIDFSDTLARELTIKRHWIKLPLP